MADVLGTACSPLTQLKEQLAEAHAEVKTSEQHAKAAQGDTSMARSEATGLRVGESC